MPLGKGFLRKLKKDDFLTEHKKAISFVSVVRLGCPNSPRSRWRSSFRPSAFRA